MASITLDITANDRASAILKSVADEVRSLASLARNAGRSFDELGRDTVRSGSAMKAALKAVKGDAAGLGREFGGLGNSGVGAGNRIAGGMRNAGGAANSATTEFRGLGIAGVAAGNLIANVFATTVISAIGAATAGLDLFVGAIKEAGNLELTGVASAGSFSAVSGLDFEKSSIIQEALRADIARENASAPGATALYTGLATGLADENAAVSTDEAGNFDLELYKTNSKNNARNFGTMAAVSGADSQAAQLAASRLLSGSSSLAELKQLEFFQKNVGFTNAIESELNGRELKDVSGKERQNIIDRATAKSGVAQISDEASKTASGQWEGFMSQIFDPDTGLFGFMRDLDPVKEGSQNVADGLREVATALFSSDGLFGALKGLFGDSDELGDPMVGLRDTLSWLKTQVDGATKWVRSFEPKRGIEGLLNAATGRLSDWFNKLDWGLVGAGLGKVVSWGLKGLIAAFSGINWSQLVFGFVGGIDYGGIGKSLGKAWFVFVGDAMGFVFDAAWRPVAAGVGWVGKSVGSFFKWVGGLWEGLKGLVGGLWGGVVGKLREFFTGMTSGATGLWTSAVGGWEKVKETLMGFWDALTGVFQKANDFVAGLNPFGGSTSAPSQPALGQTAQPIDSGNQLGMPAVLVPGNADWLTGKAQGFFPDSGLGGLLQTISTEAQVSGATPLIANSSEVILNEPQQAAVAAAITRGPELYINASTSSEGTGGKSPVYNISASFAPVINQNGNSTPKETATDIMTELGREWSTFKSSQLSRRGMVT